VSFEAKRVDVLGADNCRGESWNRSRIIVTNLLLNDAKSEVRFKQLVRGAFTIDSLTPTFN
jgi:hypothetical protein